MADIGTNKFGLGAHGAELLDKLAAQFVAAAGDDKAGAIAAKSNRRRAAYAGKRTGDQNNRSRHRKTLSSLGGNRAR